MQGITTTLQPGAKRTKPGRRTLSSEEAKESEK